MLTIPQVSKNTPNGLRLQNTTARTAIHNQRWPMCSAT